MIREIVFRSIARLEMREAAAWYEDRQAGLGFEFLEAADETLRQIAAQPDLFPFTREPVRRAFLRRFPCAIDFVDETDRFVVLAVFHGKRDPSQFGRA